MNAESLESTKEAYELLEAIAESNSSYVSTFQISQVHQYLDIRTAKSVNQFFYNMATTTWALKHVLFVIDFKVLTVHGEGNKGH